MHIVRVLDDNTDFRRKWTAFVDRHPEATVDHCWEWRVILERAFGFKPYYLASFDSNRLTGVLPLFHVPRGFGRSALVSIPFGNYGGICADSQDAAFTLLNEARRAMHALGCSYVSLHHRIPIASGELRTSDDKARFSMTVDGTEDEVFGRFSSTIRKKIRYSIKHGVTVGTSRDTGPLYRIHTDKFRRLGTPCFPRAYFDGILEHFGDRAEIHYVYFENRPIAFNLVLYFGSSLLVTVGGDLKKHLYLHPNYFLFWHEIQTAFKRGLSEVDMCRSSRNSGPAHHKRMLGLRESPLGYQYLVSAGEKFSLRSPGAGKFRIASRIWRRIPLSCTRVIGPKLVRYFA